LAAIVAAASPATPTPQQDRRDLMQLPDRRLIKPRSFSSSSTPDSSYEDAINRTKSSLSLFASLTGSSGNLALIRHDDQPFNLPVFQRHRQVI